MSLPLFQGARRVLPCISYVIVVHGLSPSLRDRAACARNNLSDGPDDWFRANFFRRLVTKRRF
jgi:hypothetical protein